MAPQYTNWQHLAERASMEIDPKKLISLVEELNRTLAENERSTKSKQAQGPI
jgi:hypothetical protein